MAGFQEHLEDLFAPLGGVSLRRMFGGLGVFRRGLMFALVSDHVLYMKADEETRARFEDEGSGPFVYRGMKNTVAMPYWQVPDRLLEEPDEFVDWASTAFKVAERTKKVAKAKPAKRTAKAAKKPAPRKGPTRALPTKRKATAGRAR